jgi:hypothetical protein
MRPLVPHSLTSRLVMRNPLRTKNASTPRKPPGIQLTPAW